jgi:hypothetical protein
MALKGGGSGSAGAVRAGAAFVELFTKDTALERGLKQASAKLRSWGAGLSKIGLGAIGAASPILGGLFKAADTLGDLTKVKNVADAFGMGAEAATGFFGVMKAAGSDVRDATEGLVTFGQRVDDALAGKGEEAAELFKQLGVGAQEFAGLSADEKIYKFHAALLALQDPAKRVQLLLKGVGEDTGKNMINILAMSTDQLREQARGFAMSGAELRSAKEATLAYNRATAALSRVWQQVSVSVAPVITKLADAITPLIRDAAEFVRENRAIFAGLAAAGLAVGALGAAFVGVGTALSVAGMAFSGFAAAAGTALSAIGAVGSVLATIAPYVIPVVAVGAALVAVGYALSELTETGGAARDAITGFFGGLFNTLKTWAVSTWRWISDTFVEAWGGIANAVQQGRLDLAFKVITTGAELAWARMTLGFTRVWNQFKNYFLGGWHEAARDSELVWVTLSEQFKLVLNNFRSFHRKLWVDLVGDIRPGWAGFGDFLENVLKKAAKIGAAAFVGMMDAQLKAMMTAWEALGIGARRAGKFLSAGIQLSELKEKIDAEADAINAEIQDAQRPGEQDEIERERKKREKEIQGEAAGRRKKIPADFERDQKARDAARVGDLAKATEAVRVAQEAYRKAVADAANFGKDNPLGALVGGAGLAAPKPLPAAKIPTVAQMQSGTSVGAFQFDRRLLLGGGTDLAKEQIDATNGVRDAVKKGNEEIVRAIAGGGAFLP